MTSRHVTVVTVLYVLWVAVVAVCNVLVISWFILNEGSYRNEQFAIAVSVVSILGFPLSILGGLIAGLLNWTGLIPGPGSSYAYVIDLLVCFAAGMLQWVVVVPWLYKKNAKSQKIDVSL